MARPIIGLTTYREHAQWGVWSEDVDLQSIRYTDAIAASGGAVVLIPPAEMGVADVLPVLDGLVVSGGADVDPASYGATAHPAAGPFRGNRDAAEFALLMADAEPEAPASGLSQLSRREQELVGPSSDRLDVTHGHIH